MFSTIISIALVAVILGAAAYFLIKQSSDNSSTPPEVTPNLPDTTPSETPTESEWSK